MHTWPVGNWCFGGRIVPSRTHNTIVSLLNCAHILEIEVQSLGITEKDIGRWLIARNTSSSYPFSERLHIVISIAWGPTSTIWRSYSIIGNDPCTYSIILFNIRCFRCGSQTSDLLTWIVDVYFLNDWILIEQLLPKLLLIVELYICCQPCVIVNRWHIIELGLH